MGSYFADFISFCKVKNDLAHLKSLSDNMICFKTFGANRMKNDINRLTLINEFESAPDSTLFPQNTVAAVRCCTPALLERERWLGNGIPYIKINRRCLYKKQDVLDWINQHQKVSSTSEYVEVCDGN